MGQALSGVGASWNTVQGPEALGAEPSLGRASHCTLLSSPVRFRVEQQNQHLAEIGWTATCLPEC